MNQQIILIDFDGVISPGEYFSEIYSREQGVDIKKLLPFFENTKDDINLGEYDLKIELEKVIDDWEWKGSVEELLEYWFAADSYIDPEIVSICKALRKNSKKIYLVSDQEKYRAEYIWNEKGLRDFLDGSFSPVMLAIIRKIQSSLKMS